MALRAWLVAQHTAAAGLILHGSIAG
eukprot:SAG11_NODE_2104_length_3818_cov_4.175316_1_plen_25_part_10